MRRDASDAGTDTDEYLPLDRRIREHYEVEPSRPVRAEFAGRTDPGKVRPNNEDQFMVVRRSRKRDLICSSVPEELLVARPQLAYTAIVADGIGGHRFGELASLMALRVGWELGGDEVKWMVKTNPQEVEDLKSKSTIFMQLIHRALRAESESNPRLRGMGTTMTIGYSVGTNLFVIHVGDSRAYLHRDGAVRRLTRDHTLAQMMIDLGQAEPDSPEALAVRHVLSNALGVGEGDVYVEFSCHGLEDSDRLLLCTDGLTDLVGDEELGPILDAYPDPADACRALVDLALERGGKDNVTVVVGRYAIVPEAEAASPSG